MLDHIRSWALVLVLLCVSCLPAAEPDYVVTTGTTVVDGGELGLGPGSVIGVAAGAHRIIRFRNLHGSAAEPIVIRNHQGLVTIDNRCFADRTAAGIDEADRLLPDSPAIDTGTPWPLIDWPIATDHFGRPRLRGGTIDVGAEEWQPLSRRIRIQSERPSHWQIDPPAASSAKDDDWTLFTGLSPQADHLLTASPTGPD